MAQDNQDRDRQNEEPREGWNRTKQMTREGRATVRTDPGHAAQDPPPAADDPTRWTTRTATTTTAATARRTAATASAKRRFSGRSLGDRAIANLRRSTEIGR